MGSKIHQTNTCSHQNRCTKTWFSNIKTCHPSLNILHIMMGSNTITINNNNNILTTKHQSRWALEIVLWTIVVLRQPTQTTPSLMEGKRSTVSSASSWVVKTKFLHKHFYLTSFCNKNFIILSYRILQKYLYMKY